MHFEPGARPHAEWIHMHEWIIMVTLYPSCWGILEWHCIGIGIYARVYHMLYTHSTTAYTLHTAQSLQPHCFVCSIDLVTESRLNTSSRDLLMSYQASPRDTYMQWESINTKCCTAYPPRRQGSPQTVPTCTPYSLKRSSATVLHSRGWESVHYTSAPLSKKHQLWHNTNYAWNHSGIPPSHWASTTQDAGSGVVWCVLIFDYTLLLQPS